MMYRFLKAILPGPLRDRLNEFLLQQLREKRAEYEKVIPKVPLAEKHIAHTRLLLTREQMLELLPKGGVVAEVGVNRGDFSERIWAITAPQKLHLVDMWGSRQFPDQLMEVVRQKFHEQIAAGTVAINRGLSTEVAEQFPEHYFDWVYIDTNHSYATTRDELAVYSRKVKPGGILAGHDFILGNWVGGVRYGVIEAVYEFCQNEDWELIWLTMENGFPPSFAIRKIAG